MELNLRELNKGDYDTTLCPWWLAYGFTPPLKEFLPNNGEGGMIVYEGEEPICAGYLYETNSSVAWSEWVISDKNYVGDNKSEAVSLLLQGIEDLAKGKGFSFIFANNNNSALVKHYKKNGYTVGCSDSTEIIKAI
tara:strand:- start:227 stop:634 length:408 start_codon:yes stop_codon:yes gene_type:complete